MACLATGTEYGGEAAADRGLESTGLAWSGGAETEKKQTWTRLDVEMDGNGLERMPDVRCQTGVELSQSVSHVT